MSYVILDSSNVLTDTNELRASRLAGGDSPLRDLRSAFLAGRSLCRCRSKLCSSDHGMGRCTAAG